MLPSLLDYALVAVLAACFIGAVLLAYDFFS